jgi:ubiquinone/menaquinone biosynthesis C-methylase UbiE
LTEAEVRGFYERDSSVYNNKRFKSSHGKYSDFVQKSAVFDLLQSCRGKRVLEIGSGTGRFTREMAKRGAHVVCADLSRNMHGQSRAGLPCGSAAFFVMSGSNLAFGDGCFDACVSVNVMSHIENIGAVLSEVRRVLKPGGVFVANFPNYAGFYFPLGTAVNLSRRSVQAKVYSRWYTFGGVFGLLRHVGLEPAGSVCHLVFPVSHCPDFLFKCLVKFDAEMRSSWTRFLLGDVFVKSIAPQLGCPRKAEVAAASAGDDVFTVANPICAEVV